MTANYCNTKEVNIPIVNFNYGLWKLHSTVWIFTSFCVTVLAVIIPTQAYFSTFYWYTIFYS